VPLFWLNLRRRHYMACGVAASVGSGGKG
jgi:hypothetical protein